MTQACASSVTEVVERAISAPGSRPVGTRPLGAERVSVYPQFLPREFVEAELTSQAQALKSGIESQLHSGT